MSGNEKMGNISLVNQELKSTDLSNILLFTNKKRTKTQTKITFSSNSTKKNGQKNKLSSISKIRLRFVRKLTKKIKQLKTENTNYSK